MTDDRLLAVARQHGAALGEAFIRHLEDTPGITVEQATDAWRAMTASVRQTIADRLAGRPEDEVHRVQAEAVAAFTATALADMLPPAFVYGTEGTA